jgi:CRP-like cAMP-binding protein
MNAMLQKIPKDLEKHLISASYKKSQSIFNQGDNTEYLYFITEGSVEVQTISKKGVKLSLSTYGRDESIGVLEIFNPEFHTQNVIALEDTRVVKLHVNYVKAWMQEDFDFTLYIIKILQECFYLGRQNAENIASLNIKERVILTLYTYYKDHNLHTLTKARLMQETRTQIRSLNRVLKDLIQSNLIDYNNKKFIIVDPTLLKKQAEHFI